MNESEYRIVTFDQTAGVRLGEDKRNAMLGDSATSNDAWTKAHAELAAVDKSGGLCEALSLKWLKVKFKENSTDEKYKDFGKIKSPDFKVNMVDREKTFDKAFARYAATAADKRRGLEEYYGLDGQYEIMSLSPTNDGSGTSYVARTVADSTHSYFLHSIVCPKFKGGLHAIAYYTSGGKGGLFKHVYMFDPDYGEYKVPNSKFIKWMPKFFNTFYGTEEGDSRWLKRMTLGTKRATP